MSICRIYALHLIISHITPFLTRFTRSFWHFRQFMSRSAWIASLPHMIKAEDQVLRLSTVPLNYRRLRDIANRQSEPILVK